MLSLYFGGSTAITHHTGRMANSTLVGPSVLGSMEEWVPSGRLFGGYRFDRNRSFEVGLHYLGHSTYSMFSGGTFIDSSVTAYAVSASLLYSVVIPHWYGIGDGLPPAMLFVRSGAAYKILTQSNITGDATEGYFAAVIGIGLEQELTQRWFMRLEYEHLTTAIGGPIQSAPWFKSLIDARVGGTHNVPNAMHTEIMISVGYRP